MLSQVDLKCFKLSFISYTCMMLVIMAKSSKLLLFMPWIIWWWSPTIQENPLCFLPPPSCIREKLSWSLWMLFIILIFSYHVSTWVFFRKLQKSHNSLGSSIIAYQQLVTIFQVCNDFSCHWLPFLFMHYKLPTSQNFNKINAKIAKNMSM